MRIDIITGLPKLLESPLAGKYPETGAGKRNY